jgi:hypothetical protein
MSTDQIETLVNGGKQAKESDEFRYLAQEWLVALATGLTAGDQK